MASPIILWAVTVELDHGRFVADYGARDAVVESAERHIESGCRAVAVTRLDTFDEIALAERDVANLKDLRSLLGLEHGCSFEG